MASVATLERPKAKKPEAGTVHWFNECVERGKREVFSEAVTVTPGLANVILGFNPDNRGIRPMKLAQFAADMRGGRWTFNGEPIIIAKTGELNDGQHRLHAVIDANTPTTFMFVFGVARESRLTVDQGAARSANDYLSMEGVSHATVIASVCRLILAYERSGYDNINEANRVTNAEVLERARTDSAATVSAKFASDHHINTKPFAAPAIIGFCHYALSAENAADADVYMTQICTGEALRKSDPAYVVRDRLLNLGRNRAHKIEVIMRGWNAYRQGRSPSKLPVNGNFPALV